MLKEAFCAFLRARKNLLAFSYGSDSTALFYLLVEKNIPFDLALVNYKARENSDLEELEAGKLAAKWQKKIFIKRIFLEGGDFENRARKIRYDFFEKLCFEEGYESVLLAHQLDDRLEWFLMQLSKGAGLVELMGFNAFEKRGNYTLVRPLLSVKKACILEFLREKKIFYFNDESNANEKYERNYIRKHFAKKFMLTFGEGVKRSFEYLQKDMEGLNLELVEFKGLLICSKNESIIARAVKMKGLRISSAQREEAFRRDCVLSERVGVVHWGEMVLVFVCSPKLKLPKYFKESCRKRKIPKGLRGFLFFHQIDLDELIMTLNFRVKSLNDAKV